MIGGLECHKKQIQTLAFSKRAQPDVYFILYPELSAA